MERTIQTPGAVRRLLTKRSIEVTWSHVARAALRDMAAWAAQVIAVSLFVGQGEGFDLDVS